MNCSSHRAMTLIEVLAATALLAILGSVCASVLRSMPVMPTDATTDSICFDMLSLERAADQILDHSHLRERVIADASAEFSTPWPGEPAWPSIQIRRVEHKSSAKQPAHAWVGFSCDRFIVWRCIELPKESPIP